MVAFAKDLNYLCTWKEECTEGSWRCSGCKYSNIMYGWRRVVAIILFWLIVVMCICTIIRGVCGMTNYLLIKRCAETQEYHSINSGNLNVEVLGGSLYKVKGGIVILKYVKPVGKDGNYIEHVTGAFDTKKWRYQVLYSGHLSDKLWHIASCSKNNREATILELLQNPESRLLYKKVNTNVKKS